MGGQVLQVQYKISPHENRKSIALFFILRLSPFNYSYPEKIQLYCRMATILCYKYGFLAKITSS